MLCVYAASCKCGGGGRHAGWAAQRCAFHARRDSWRLVQSCREDGHMSMHGARPPPVWWGGGGCCDQPAHASGVTIGSGGLGNQVSTKRTMRAVLYRFLRCAAV